MNELEKIVQRMIEAGEPEENIATVIKSYNSPGKTSDPVQVESNTGSEDTDSNSVNTSSELVDPDNFENTQEKNTWIEDTFGKNQVTDFVGDFIRAKNSGIAGGNSVDEAYDV